MCVCVCVCVCVFKHRYILTQWARAVGYTNCFSAEG